MPFHVAPLNRRRFLLGSAGFAAGLLLPRPAGAKDQDPDRWALLSDPHTPADPEQMSRGNKMAENLRRVAAEVTALDRLPTGVLLNGDCAYGNGEPGEYVIFAGLMKPFTAAGIPFHVTLGNHDHRENLRAGMIGAGGGKGPLESKQVGIVAGSRVNWFLLDSLESLSVGKLGDEQRKWLADALDARKDRPAVVMVHHNPALPGPDGKVAGLTDTQELYDLLTPRKHVKALIFGHTHHWELQQREGLHLINLPAIAYPFRAGDPTGWVDCKLTAQGASLELRALDSTHPAHGKVTQLKWRVGCWG